MRLVKLTRVTNLHAISSNAESAVFGLVFVGFCHFLIHGLCSCCDVSKILANPIARLPVRHGQRTRRIIVIIHFRAVQILIIGGFCFYVAEIVSSTAAIRIELD